MARPARELRSALRLILAVLLFVPLLSSKSGVMLSRPSEAVPAKFFGMHVQHIENWPDLPFGTIRLGNPMGVSWRKLEPARGQYEFGKLDAWLKLAEERHVSILLPAGGSPTWASARPEEDGSDGKGNAAEPADLKDWTDYLTTVATRYKGRIEAYELWNEPDAKGYYTGSIENLVKISCAGYKAIKAADPKAIVVSPAVQGGSTGYLDKFLKAGGGECFDVVGYHFYVYPNGPEDVVRLIGKVKQAMEANGVDKPLWNTEQGWSKVQFPDDDIAAAYVARAYVLNWVSGVERFYWYAYDDQNWVTLRMMRDGKRTLAARAYIAVNYWLAGATVTECKTDLSGREWQCTLRRNGKTSYIVWNTSGTGTWKAPRNWHAFVAASANGSSNIIRNKTVVTTEVPQLLQ